MSESALAVAPTRQLAVGDCALCAMLHLVAKPTKSRILTRRA